jgi:hypothetical protein
MYPLCVGNQKTSWGDEPVDKAFVDASRILYTKTPLCVARITCNGDDVTHKIRIRDKDGKVYTFDDLKSDGHDPPGWKGGAFSAITLEEFPRAQTREEVLRATKEDMAGLPVPSDEKVEECVDLGRGQYQMGQLVFELDESEIVYTTHFYIRQIELWNTPVVPVPADYAQIHHADEAALPFIYQRYKVEAVHSDQFSVDTKAVAGGTAGTLCLEEEKEDGKQRVDLSDYYLRIAAITVGDRDVTKVVKINLHNGINVVSFSELEALMRQGTPDQLPYPVIRTTRVDHFLVKLEGLDFLEEGEDYKVTFWSHPVTEKDGFTKVVPKEIAIGMSSTIPAIQSFTPISQIPKTEIEAVYIDHKDRPLPKTLFTEALETVDAPFAILKWAMEGRYGDFSRTAFPAPATSRIKHLEQWESEETCAARRQAAKTLVRRALHGEFDA